MFQYRFANAARVFLCEMNCQESENMKNEPNNTHIPCVARCVVNDGHRIEGMWGIIQLVFLVLHLLLIKIMSRNWCCISKSYL